MEPNVYESDDYPPRTNRQYPHGLYDHSPGSDRRYPHGLYDHSPDSEDPDYYHHSGSGLPDSDSESSEEEDPLAEGYTRKGYHFNAFDYLSAGMDPARDPDFLLSRLQRSQSDDRIETKDDDGEESKAVDPGLFRYNKRVFVTALPCLLLMLVMTGETLLVIVTIGGMIIALMTQMGVEMSKRCVVVFALLFIPCHILVVGTVLPLLWLSWWNSLLVGFINMFCILTGGWIIIQFEAFRKEDASMCGLIEQMLFAYYPFICCALVTWVLSTVVSTLTIPFVFISIWFVCLQLYLLPAVSSFKITDSAEADLSVLQQKTVVYIVIGFVISGPLLHVVLSVSSSAAVGVFSVSSLVLFALLACLGLFLSTLLSLRQLCDYHGLSHALPAQVRWSSGVGLLVLSYPVLQQLGMVSHFLLSLPVAVAGFIALGIALSVKKGKMLPLLLMTGLMLLLCVWLAHLPWALNYRLLGTVPLRLFYVLVACNFVLCVLTVYTAWHNSVEVFGLLLLLQSAGITVCETGLYRAGLYTTPTFQLSGVVAAYAFYRLHGAGKLRRNVAAAASAMQLTKTVVSALSYLVKGWEKEGGSTNVDLSAMDFLTLLLFVGMMVWLFLIETKEEVSPVQAGKHLTLLMISLAVSGQSFLMPIGQLLLQDVPTLADLVGLWFGIGGLLVMLYALQHSQCERLLDELVKVSMVLAGVGAIVMVMQPQFAFSLWTIFQWSEVLSLLLIAALLATGVEMHCTQILITGGALGIWPGIHATLLLYSDATLLHFLLMSTTTCLLLAFVLLVVKVDDVTGMTEKFIKLGTLVALGLVVALISVDVINLEKQEGMFIYPAWKVAFGVTTLVSLCLKSLSMKLGPKLPMVRKESDLLPALPLFGNVATVLSFLLAATQGPQDWLLHDLWCCAAALVLILLQRDSLLLPSLSPGNRATPTVLAAVATLVQSSLLQSRVWSDAGKASVFFGCLEVLSIVGSVPVYLVLAGIMWSGAVWSEKAVVFCLPLNAFIFLLASSYTAWALAVSGAVCGVGMMVLKLPLQPYVVDHR